MFRHVRLLALAFAVLAFAATARADARNRGTHNRGRQPRLLLAPLSTLGNETKSNATARIKRHLISGLRAVGGYTLVSSRELARALRRSHKSQLRSCDGAVDCLTDLGKLLGAKLVVYAEVGGLGSAQVVYLKLVNVSRGKEVRSTTLELGRNSNATRRARAAAFRLLAPKRFTGKLVTQVDVKGATIYVDGQRMAKSPAAPISLAVGTHALRITHPEFRDFVRFINIKFDQRVKVKADMLQYPIVSSGMNQKSGPGNPNLGKGNVIYKGVQPTPWYRKWYVVAGAAALVLTASAVTVGLLVDSINADSEKTVEPPQ